MRSVVETLGPNAGAQSCELLLECQTVTRYVPIPKWLTEGVLEPFPSPELAGPDGLLAIGGDLSPERLLLAYRSGIFPWYEESTPILWWSPDPRAVIEFDSFHVPKRLQRIVRQGRFTVTADEAFRQVMRGCAENRPEGTWITDAMLEAYCRFHELGYAHSVETWSGGELAGGIYGVAIGGMFCAESMFHRVSSAGNVALVHLVQRLRERGYVLLDVQIINPHTARFGATEIPRSVYLRRLAEAIRLPVSFGP